MVREELERCDLAVLLAHEQERHERRQQRAERSERSRLARQPVPQRAVPDLVVILGVDDEATWRDVVGGCAEAPAAEARVGPVVDVRAMERLRQLVHAAEVLVVAVLLGGDDRVQRVMEVVRPRGVAPVPAAGNGPHHPWVVES